MSIRSPLLAVVPALAFGAVLQAQGGSVVLPAPFKTAEGPFTGSSYSVGAPWYTTSSTTFRQYHQQVIMDLPTTVKGKITGIAFRRDGASFAGTPSPNFNVDLELALSTAKTKAATAVSTFANNEGTDRTVVIARKMIKIGTRPFLGTFPEPFLFSLPLDKPMVFDATKGSLAYDLKHYGNDLYVSATRTFRYAYVDAVGNTSFGPTLSNGSRCFPSNPFAAFPIRASSTAFITTIGGVRRLRFYGWVFSPEPNSLNVFVTSGGNNKTGIPLDCGTLTLDLGKVLVIAAGQASSSGSSLRFPQSSSSYLFDLPYDFKTMAGVRLYSQAIEVTGKGKLAATNWTVKQLPHFLPTGQSWPMTTIYRVGSSAFTSTTGFVRRSTGPVVQITWQ